MRAQQRKTVSPPVVGRPGDRFVDYSLQRRAVLREVYSGRVGTSEVCDASPYLKAAARFHGEATETRCPICRREFVRNVYYIYGDQLKHSAGQARKRAELAALADTLGEFQVYVVEVCPGCDWNHLIEQYLLGRAHAAAPPQPDTATATSPTGTV